MRKIIYLLLVTLAFFACQDNDSSFPANMTSDSFSFRPIAGGAVMHYKLPAEKDIVSINIRYKDAQGKDMFRTGSVHADSLTLVGFDEATQNVPAFITLSKSNLKESEPIEVSFDTYDSGPVSFFNSVEVKPAWNGFIVEYEIPAYVTGMAHVFYLGTDPMTNEPDTILINSFNLRQGKETLAFSPKQVFEEYDVVIRTEDFRGYMVKEEIWKNIASYNTDLLDPKEFDFYDRGFSNEAEKNKIGKKYLFDGDTKGETWKAKEPANTHFTFLAGPDAIGEPMYIDMRTPLMTASMRFYCMLHIGQSMRNNDWGNVFNHRYYIVLPCSISVFAANDDAAGADNWESKTWVKLGEYSQSPDAENSARWCRSCNNNLAGEYFLSTLDDVLKAKPNYLQVDFPPEGQEQGYRYLKFIVNDTYNDSYYVNSRNYFSIHELEIYTQRK